MHDDNATPIEAIDFETLRPSVEQSKQGVNSKAIIWFAFSALLLCALIVFLFLPNYVAEKNNQDISEIQTQIDTPSPSELAESIKEKPETETIQEALVTLSTEELSALKQEAEELLLQLIEKQKLLEAKSIKKWADEEFKIALTLGASGDEHLRKQEYQLAIASYKDAVMVLQDLELKIAPTIAEHLEKGELALTQAEKDTAIIHFELVKSIEVDNTQAINGLKRAETIEELYALLKQGGQFEAANHFDNAKNTYQKATELDPLSIEAKAALDRVTGRLAQNEFTRLMSQGNAALIKRQYGDARAAFTRAQKLLPSSSKPKQGIAAIEQAIRNEKLSALTVEAQHFEDNQDWDNAAKSYQHMLKLSPNSTTAQQGLERSQQREEILTQLGGHIENKMRLGSDKVANQAKRLLQEIAILNNPGSKIETGATTLKELIQLASQPISITLQSDNQTDIAIFRVGKFGKLEQRKVELKTGKYTIVGSRPGFRDVRKVLTVTADMPSKNIQIRCEEKI